jgi:hypothetical protein
VFVCVRVCLRVRTLHKDELSHPWA